MRFLFNLIACTTALLFATPNAIADLTTEEGRELARRKRRRRKPVINANTELLIHYKNRNGRRHAMKLSKEGKFDKILYKHKIAALKARDKEAIKSLRRDRNIKSVEPDAMIYALAMRSSEKVTLSEEASRQLQESISFGNKMVQADQIWAMNEPPVENISVCVVDTGYALGHPDLPTLADQVTGDSTAQGEWDFDPNGHGSHCAGIIGAIGDNNVGVTGVNKDPSKFRFHIVKALDDAGESPTSTLLENMEKCLNAGSKVISLSLGSLVSSEGAESFYKDAYDQGVLVISAAGNDGDTSKSFPASFPHVMSVAAVDKDGKVASYSQTNDQVEIAGPGSANSTDTDDTGRGFLYKERSGSSMAAPYVAGVAAMVWSYFPTCSNNQIRNVLLRTAKDAGPPGCDQYSGHGIVQAKAAYDLLEKHGCIAGDESPVPLSSGGVGGCLQDPNYIPPPPEVNSTADCNDKLFRLELTTDNYARETSWELKDSRGAIVASGGDPDYLNAKAYTISKCLAADQYKFTIRDTGNDGLCCLYSKGSYTIYYDDKLIKEGMGDFEAEESVTFGTHPTYPRVTCKDDDEWVYTDKKGKVRKGCRLIGRKNSPCRLEGIGKSGKATTGFTSCPNQCDSCGVIAPASSPTSLPTNEPTDQPTAWPTSSPTFQPTASPTAAPTSSPTAGPTISSVTSECQDDDEWTHTDKKSGKVKGGCPWVAAKMRRCNKKGVNRFGLETTGMVACPVSCKVCQQSVVKSSTPPPSQMATNEPTAQPTKNPTIEPTGMPMPSLTSKATASPTATPTLAPTTGNPTWEPTDMPTPSPTSKATESPTTTPTLVPTTGNPTWEPTDMPTPSPTSEPTASPTAKPTSMPTLYPTKPPTPMPAEAPTKPDPTKPPTLEPTPQPMGNPTTHPDTPVPRDSPQTTSEGQSSVCKDDMNWTYIWKKKGRTKIRDCDWVGDPDAAGEGRCKLKGTDESTAEESCPKTCGTCSSLGPLTAPVPGPRLATSPKPGGGKGVGSNPLQIDFEGGSLKPFALTGGARNPWQPDATAACGGTSMGAKAGVPGGVDFTSYLTISVPDGVTSMTYYYSYPSALDIGDDFHVVINDLVIRSYETGSGADCAMDTVSVSPNDTVIFKCKSGGLGETCAIDEVQFS